MSHPGGENPLDEAFIRMLSGIYPAGELMALSDGERQAAEIAFFSGAAAAARIMAEEGPQSGGKTIVSGCIAHAARISRSL